MAVARKYPDVAFKSAEELNIDMLLLDGHVVTQGDHRVSGRPLRTHFAEWIAGAHRDHAVVGVERSGSGLDGPSSGLPFDVEHPHLLNLCAGLFGPLQ